MYGNKHGSWGFQWGGVALFLRGSDISARGLNIIFNFICGVGVNSGCVLGGGAHSLK